MERNCYNCGYGGDGEEIDDYCYCWLHNGKVNDNEITDPQKGCPEWTPRLEG